MKQTILLIDSLPALADPKGPVDYVELTWEERCKARHRCVTAGGVNIALSLPRGSYLADGTVLHNDAELSVLVRAKPEPVIAIQPVSTADLCRVSHHLGNWHRSIQVDGDTIYAYADRPLEDWLTKLGLPCQHVTRAFEPNLRSHSHD